MRVASHCARRRRNDRCARRAPARTAILLDYDGSLAPIVDRPDDARRPAGRGGAPRTARRRIRAGRDRQRPAGRVPRPTPPGRRPRCSSASTGWSVWSTATARSIHASSRTSLRSRRPPAKPKRGSLRVIVERKAGVSVTLHWRPAPDQADEVLAVAAELGRRHGLGRVAIAVRGRAAAARSQIDKGTAIDDARRRLRRSARSPATTAATSRRSPRFASASTDGRLRPRGAHRGAVDRDAAPRSRPRSTCSSTGPGGLLACTRPAWPDDDRRASRRRVGTATVASARSFVARRGAFVERRRERRSSAPATARGRRVHRDGRGLQLVVRAGLGRQAQQAVAAVDGRAFLGDEVEPVADRVHEQHVVALHRRDRAREVVALVEQDRRPVARRPAIVHARDDLLDLVRVREVLGQALARRIQHRHEHDPAPQARTRLEQPVVGEEAAHDVLRRLDAVGPHDHEAVADGVVERARGRARRGLDAATASSAATSGPRLAAKVRADRRVGRALAAPTAGRRAPSGWCGSRRGCRASAAHRSTRRRRSGRTRCRPGRRTACA